MFILQALIFSVQFSVADPSFDLFQGSEIHLNKNDLENFLVFQGL